MLKEFFTTQERKVIYFLLVIFILGFSVTIYKRHFYTKPDERQKAELDSLIVDFKKKSELSLGNENLHIYTKININTASVSELEKLPGIGKKSAENIISYREMKGNFEDIEDIQNVKGIGKKSFEKIKNFITVEDSIILGK
jgi:competence ComEA-like helix-hairpin-helix protein